MPVPKPFDVWRKLTRHRYDASLSLLATNVPNGLPITMTIFPPELDLDSTVNASRDHSLNRAGEVSLSENARTTSHWLLR